MEEKPCQTIAQSTSPWWKPCPVGMKTNEKISSQFLLLSCLFMYLWDPIFIFTKIGERVSWLFLDPVFSLCMICLAITCHFVMLIHLLIINYACKRVNTCSKQVNIKPIFICVYFYVTLYILHPSQNKCRYNIRADQTFKSWARFIKNNNNICFFK